jgi:oxygen tolerance protein BatD
MHAKHHPTEDFRLKLLVAIFLLVTFCLMTMNVSAALTAELERNHISAGETVQLLVETDRQVSGWLDTRPLEKDFDILGNISGSRVNIINGRVDATTTWTITLAPKHSGKLTIPPLEMDGEHSDSLTLQVSDAPVTDSEEPGNPVFIETEVDRQDPYVQGMVRYTVRLYFGVKLIEGQLSEPQSDNALVHRIGEDRDFTVERDGQHYRVIERQYAIFPQISGKLVLPAPVLDARIAESSTIQRNRLPDFFGGDPLNSMFRVTRPVRIRGEAEVLSVQPRPDEAGDFPWLPAEQVELLEDWQPQDSAVNVGDPLKRTVIIRARGVTGEQLPDLDPGDIDGFKVYPDHPKIDTKNLAQNVEGEKSHSIAYVPIQSGRFVLPAINLQWWDTKNNQARVARIPERTVEILPAVNAENAPTQSNAAMPEMTDNAKSFINDEPGNQPSANGNSLLNLHDKPRADLVSTQSGIWPWMSILFALLWLATLGMWWRSKRHQPHAILETSVSMNNQENVRYAKKHFQSACEANDPQLARRRLMEWAVIHWPNDPPAGLEDLSCRFVDPKVKVALAELDQSLYRDENHSWDGSQLASLITKLPQHDRQQRIKTPLPDLYV